MNSKKLRALIFTLGAAVCATAIGIYSWHAQPSLKDVFAEDFRVGVAVSSSQVLGDEPRALQLVQRQFNSITSENLLKWENVHPEPGVYDFEPVDRFVEFGEKNEMFIVGHTLVWHKQTPGWVFRDVAGHRIDRDGLMMRLREHIQAVVGRYKGRIKGWDVVNEAIEEGGELRRTKWLEIIGEDYIEKAFQYAHEADPGAELYYNDYDEWKPEVRRGIRDLVQKLQRKGIRIDGIGCQAHWGMDYPSDAEIQAMFEDYGQLGVKLMVTELDINICDRVSARNPWLATIRRSKADALAASAIDAFPIDLKSALAERYGRIFRLLLDHRTQLDRVTFWGVHDGQSWYNDFPMKCRAPYPLLFDRMYQPKLAFDAVIQTGSKGQSPAR